MSGAALGVPATLSQAAAEVERIASEAQEPAWLVERRRAAIATYLKTPMPDPHRDEDWRRMSFLGLDLERRPLHAEDALHVEAGGDALPQGAFVGSLAEGISRKGDLLEARYGTSVVPATHGRFEALSLALARSGAVIHVPKGVKLERPILLRGKAGPAGGASGFGAFRRTLVHLEAGAEATVITIEEGAEGPGLLVGAVEATLEAGARLRHATIQVLGADTWAFETRRALVGRDAKVEWVTCDLGAKVSRTVVDSHLFEPGGRAESRGMIFGDRKQKTDLMIRMIHVARETESDMLVRAALGGEARSIYRGYVDMKRGCKNANSQQKEAVLLLSEKARTDAIPSLYIDENDVKAGHGATAGRVDERHLFYLMSRGIPKTHAEKLIVEGFFAPLLERISIEGVREELLARIDAKIG